MATRSAKDIIDVLTRIPKNLSIGDTALWAGAGAGAGLLGALALTKNKKNLLRNSIAATAIGGLLGGLGNLIRHNAVTDAGGHFREDPDYYDPDKLISDIKSHGDRKDVQLYINGVMNTPGGMPPDYYNKDREHGTYVFRWGDGAKAAAAAKKLMEEGYRPHIVAHSAGGTAALDILDKLDQTHELGSVNLLDPADLNLARSASRRLGLMSPYKNKVAVHVPMFHKDRALFDRFDDAEKWSSSLVLDNPLALVDTLPGAQNRYWNDSHYMLLTGLKRPWNKPVDSWFSRIKDLDALPSKLPANIARDRRFYGLVN